MCIVMGFQLNRQRLIKSKLVTTWIVFSLGYIQYYLELSGVYLLDSLELQAFIDKTPNIARVDRLALAHILQ